MHALSQLSNGASGRKKGLGLISRPSIDQSAGSGLGAFARNGIVEASIRPSLIPPRSNQSLFFLFLFYFWGLFVTFQLLQVTEEKRGHRSTSRAEKPEISSM